MKRLSLLFLGVASPLIVLTFWVAAGWASVLFALLAVGFPIALIALGASRQGRVGPLAIPILSLALVLETCVIVMLILRGRVGEGPWIAGLPLAAAVQLYGMWLAPLALVALAYALTFESFTLPDADLERLRRAVSKHDGGR